MPKQTQPPPPSTNGQYYDWSTSGPDMSKYSAPSAGAPPPYGFTSSHPSNPPPPYRSEPPPDYPPSAPQTAPAANVPYPPPQSTAVTVPMAVVTPRSQQMVRRILWIRVTIVLVGLVITIVGAVTGYYSTHRYYYN